MKGKGYTQHSLPDFHELNKLDDSTPPIPILTSKLHIPTSRRKLVHRARLIERLNEGIHRKLSLISAPAGSGKTTLVSEWVSGYKYPVAWLSLDKWDNDATRFLIHLIAALQTIAKNVGNNVFRSLQSPQPPTIESILSNLINDLNTISDNFVLVLDDYHVIDAKPVDDVLDFLLEQLPPQMHLVIITREDPNLPVSRLRARGQLTELRLADLRFTFAETGGFLNQVMDLNLSPDDIAALENRTEGWIAGLQLAAISIKHKDTTEFINSFTGSHQFILDYLVEEVLQQLPENIQTFLLYTSILDNLYGPLCDAVLLDPSVSGKETLKYLDRINLFIIPQDNERRWYRYHHLFSDLLRQRLLESNTFFGKDKKSEIEELHRRASLWYESNGMEIEAFHHAVAANDIDHASRLMEGNGMPLHFRGAVAPVLNWLESLSTTVLDKRPSLWVMYASALSMTGRLASVESNLQAAEIALEGAEIDDNNRDMIGHIAAIRALLAAVQNQAETVIVQSRRALEYLKPDNLAVRTATTWKMGWAYQLQRDWEAARNAYTEAISICKSSGNHIIAISATIGLGNVQEAENQLDLANETYKQVLQMTGEPPLPVACEAYLGLARIFYEWNDLDAAEQHVRQSIHLALQIENTDKLVACNVLRARLKLARGNVTDASVILAEADSPFAMII